MERSTLIIFGTIQSGVNRLGVSGLFLPRDEERGGLLCFVGALASLSVSGR